jgi:hypothetical protein
MTLKKLALVAVLLVGSLTAAVAGPASYSLNDRPADVGENGGGGAGS